MANIFECALTGNESLNKNFRDLNYWFDLPKEG